MKNKYLLIIWLFLVSSHCMFAQQAPIVEVSIQQPSAVCVEGGCVDLIADYFITKPTTDYTVEPVIYQNLYSYTGGQVLVVDSDDQWSEIFELPFSFNFYGQNYTKLLVGANGVITFDIAGIGLVPDGEEVPLVPGGCAWSFNSTIPNANFPITRAIYGVYQDTNLQTPPIQNALIQNVNYYVGGTAPNRYFVANFNRLPQFQCNGTLGATVEQDIGLQTSQIVIYETTNVIDVTVRKRSSCLGWQGGNGVIGVQNQAGTAADTPPGRNTGAWPATNEGWRFIPSGVGPDLVTLTWEDASGTVLGTGNPLNVCIEDEDVPETITAVVTYINGTTTAEATADITLSVAPDLPVLDPLDITLCTSDPAPYVFPTINQDAYILNGASEFDYEIYYFKEEDAAAAYNKQTSQALNTGAQTNFTLPDNDPYTIYVLIIDAMGTGCHNVRTFTLQGGNPSGTFSYPDDGGSPGFCMNSNPAMPPVLADLTAGGTYTIAPTTGLIIDPDTGVLDLTGATPATYMVTYTIPEVPGSCPEYVTTTTVLIEGCFSTTPVTPTPVCEGTPTFNLTTSDAGPGATYTWSGPNGFTSNVKDPVNVPVPSVADDYTYTVFATISGTNSAPQSVILTVHPTPEAAFVFVNPTICTNEFTYLAFTGTPGATVTFNNGSANNTVTLDAAGSGQFTTPTLTAPITYTITQVIGNTIPACTFTVPAGAYNSVTTISVGLPTATMVGFTDPVICLGTAGSFTIQGTPEATVTYTVDGGTPSDVTLPTSGQLLVTTPIMNVPGTFTYELTNIATTGANDCSSALSGETATLTVNALPTASFSTTTPTVCQNTPATINFTGPAGATVTYTDHTGATAFAPLDASGNFSLTTANLPDPNLSYTFTLVSVEETLLGVTCSAPLTGSLTIEVDADPVFVGITPATGTVLCIGDTVTLEVDATGDGLSYQWYKDSPANPVGSNLATFTIPSATSADAGDYYVVITGSCGTPATSTIVELILNQPTVIVDESPGATYCQGDTISLFVDATGVGLTFQWYKGTDQLQFETNPTLTIAPATLADAGTYRCVISNPCPQQETTQNMVVVVNELPGITAHPQAPAPICVGEPIDLFVTAAGTGLTYEWRLNGNPIPGAPSSSSYNDPSVTLAEAGDYTVVVSGACAPPVTSNMATVVVNEGATITQQTQVTPSDTVCSGTTISLSVATIGGTNVSYQWLRGTTPVGTDSELLTINSAQVSDTGVYTCVISSDSCPSFSSDPLAITINQAPVITDEPEDANICEGERHYLKVEATGSNIAYQWYKGTVALTNGNTNVYEIASATVADSGDYHCVLSSAPCADVTSVTVTLTVKPLPVATVANGTESEICSGESSEIVFTGTPGAVVTYNIVGVVQNETALLNPVTGEAIVATGTLAETTVYELVSVSYTGTEGCLRPLTGSVTVTVHELPQVSIEDGYICVDPVTLAVTRNYTMDTGLNDGDYTFEWSDASGVILGAVLSFYEASAVGQYAVKITDIVTGCEQTAFATVDQSSPPISFDYTVNGFFSQNPTVTITAQPAGDYEYQLDYGPFQDSNVFDNIGQGIHTITVRDPQACDVLTQEVTIIDYPKYFTPNGDGIHDTWNISEFSEQLNAKIYIFDRFGKLVKEISTKGLGWDGTYNGQPLPATDYWFTLDYEENGVAKQFKSHFAMKR